jgi:hypothetical protein
MWTKDLRVFTICFRHSPVKSAQLFDKMLPFIGTCDFLFQSTEFSSQESAVIEVDSGFFIIALFIVKERF